MTGSDYAKYFSVSAAHNITAVSVETAVMQSVKEVSQICELFGIIGEKENRRGKKNGTVAAG